MTACCAWLCRLGIAELLRQWCNSYQGYSKQFRRIWSIHLRLCSIREQIQAWAELNAIKNKTEVQTAKQQDLEKEIRRILKIEHDDKAPTNKRTTLIQEIETAKQKTGALIAEEAEYKKKIEETTKAIEDRKVEINKENIEYDYVDYTEKAASPEKLAKLYKEDKTLKNLNEQIKIYTESINKNRAAREALYNISEEDFKPPEEEAKPKEIAPSKEEDPLQKTIREQDER